jgi:hypothetical protein
MTISTPAIASHVAPAPEYANISTMIPKIKFIHSCHMEVCVCDGFLPTFVPGDRVAISCSLISYYRVIQRFLPFNFINKS